MRVEPLTASYLIHGSGANPGVFRKDGAAFPLLVLTLVAHTGVARRIPETLKQAPELQGGGAS